MDFKRIGCLALPFILLGELAIAQLTPDQLRLKDEYLKKRQNIWAASKANYVEQYKNTIDFSNQDTNFYKATPGNILPAKFTDSTNAADKDTTLLNKQDAEDSLKIFGYNLFEGSPDSFSPILESTPPPDYRLGPGDNLLINIWGRVDMQLDLTVDREGKVFIPKAGDVTAWGVTLEEFRRLVDSRLSAIYSGYQFSVTLGKIRQIKIFVYGEVKRPGGYTTSSLATLFNALYLAGGPNQTGSLRTIKHIRGNKVLARIDLYRFLIEGDNSQDSRLESGDVIFVPVVGPLVKVSGQVKRPAIYEIAGGEKATDIIGLAGSPSAEAYLEMISVERVGMDDSRIIQDIDLSDKLKDSDPQSFDNYNLALKDGDWLRIPSVFDFRKNTVILMGNVKHPGVFGLTDSMRVSDLIGNGEQFQHDTFLGRANLFRTFPDQRHEIYAINLDQILKGIDSTNYPLLEMDSVVIYSQDEIKREMTLSINGAVKRPGVYKYFENMRLSDLVFLGGNPLRQSYLLQAEIARVVPGKPAEIIYADLDKALSGDNQADDILLEEDDIVSIRTIPQWRIYNSVVIEGEVMFPGTYEIMKEGERLLDLIQRSGGFTDDAFPDGLVFRRRSISESVEKRHARTILASTELTILDSLNRQLPKLNETLDIKSADRIIINPLEILKNPNSPDNIPLERGDYVYVPGKPAGVQVLGAVASNGTIVYKKGKKMGYFVKASGGFSSSADKGQARLAKANGKVLAGKEAFNSRVDAGDIIIVPQKLIREKQWMKSASFITAITSSILTTILLVDRLK